ncbi:hypothetical protein EXIGLDRAFT_758462 [Exidia glandulosa HHB12029]|uniref:non-specific serine/threonine protein kinase n=1 Tax=Exidia glandulosa HHB12029 TaxID=1314781 RepID=A0A165QWH0_EXIGL|nr:hypothetical protein EXIGLDRAFT_758462 [Exidia glandulosa HHB12029]
MLSTATTDLQQLIDFIHAFSIQNDPQNAITPSQVVSYIDVAVAYSASFLQPTTHTTWDEDQRNIQKQTLDFIRLVVNKAEGVFSSPVQFEVVVFPRILRLLFSLERWNSFEPSPDLKVTPEALRTLAFDTAVELLLRMGEDLMNRDEKTQRGWQILRDIVSRLLHTLQELRTMPSASFPIIVDIMKEPYIVDAAMGSGDPFKSARPEDSPAVTLENQGHLLSFATLSLLILSRTLQPKFVAACFTQSQVRSLLDVLGQYANVVLSAPMNARTIPFYCRLAESLQALSASCFPGPYLQQHLGRFLAVRLKEGTSSALQALDQQLVALFRASSMPIPGATAEPLRQEAWATEQSPEASSLRDIICAALLGSIGTLERKRLDELQASVAPLPTSELRDRILNAVAEGLRGCKSSMADGKHSNNIRTVLSSMGVSGIAVEDVAHPATCLTVIASVAASDTVDHAKFLGGLAKLPALYADLDIERMSLVPHYIGIARAFGPITDKSSLVLLLLAVGEAAAHTEPVNEDAVSDFVALVGKYASHSSRDVRLAAGAAIVALLSRAAELQGVVELETVCAPLQAALKNSQDCVRESAIISLGSLGKVPDDAALLFALRALILQLGQKNILVRGLAHLQLRSIAAHYKKSMYSLISPFMPEISRLVVGKLTTSPATLIEFCRIASTSPMDFITQTLHHTLPVIVHQRDAATLARISQETSRSMPALLLGDSHLSVILRMAFMSNDSDEVLEFIIVQLTKDAHGGETVRGETLVRSCILPLICELVCCLGDTAQLEGRDVIIALEKVQRKIAPASSSRRLPSLAAFLEPYLLGTITHINDLLHDVRGRKQTKEKNKLIQSFGSFFALIGPGISHVSHQAMATLQSTIKIPALSDASVGAWNKFATALTPRDIGPCIGTLSAALVSAWPQLSSAARMTAQRTLEHCVITNRDHIKGHVEKVVDLSGIPALSGAARALTDLRRNWSQQRYLTSLLQRCTGENITVTTQSLLELQRYIALDSQQFLRAVASGDVFDPLVSRIVDVLLSAAATDGEDAEAVHLIAFELLGALGAVDPDRFDNQSRERSFSILQNFEDEKESLEFATHLLELLVPAFRSTSDPRFQANVGYALQELSAFCSFTADLDKPDSRQVKPTTRRLWDALSQTARDTITPFRGAKFKVQEKDRPDIPLPIYPSQSSYRDWLQTWAMYLVSRISSPNARMIFSACRPAMRGNDARVALHLLPHIVLHVLISGSDEDRSAICAEIVVVLEDLVTPDPHPEQDRRTYSAQTIFTLLDHLNTWVRHARQHNAKVEGRDRRKRNASHLAAALEMRIVSVQSILTSIDQDLMARAAFECKAYARALMSLEQQVASASHQPADAARRERFERMHEIYSLVDEPDGMEGISTMILSPSMEMQIRQHESTGRWTAAQSCWEVKLQRSPDDLSFHIGLLRCLRNLGHYDTLRTHIQGVLTRNPEWKEDLARFEVESAWTVGDWGHVQTVLQHSQAQTAESAIARLLLSLRSQEVAAVRESFATARLHLGAPITTAGRGSYRRSYEAIMNLHVVQELDLIHNSFSGGRAYEPLGQAVQELDRRFDSVLPTFRTRESLLSMRRTAFGLSMADHTSRGFDASPLNEAIGKTWLDTAKIARKAGHFQTAYSALLQASENRATFTYVQACKLTKDNGDALKALHDLTAELSKVQGATGEGDLSASAQALPEHEKRRLAKAMVLRARWMQETARFSYMDVSKQFVTAIDLCKEWESAYFHFGYYQDETQRQTGGDAIKSQTGPTLNLQTVQNYASSLQYGSKYIYQTMPRMLTLWLDLGEEKPILLADQEGRLLKTSSNYYELQQIHFRMNNAVKIACAKIAIYKWLTAFPQLVSRVEHGNGTVRAILLGLIVKVISAYPQQGLWSFISVRQSKNANRMRRGHEVLSQLQAPGNSGLAELVNMFVKMSHELLGLCNFTCTDTTPLSIATNFPELQRLANMPVKLMLPFQEAMTATMPPRNADNSEHQPFPLDLPMIHEFKDEVEIMKSLQRPRKITIIGSDGEQYMMMAKPKDDLRKDARLMDFNTIINKLLKTNSESRRRQLHIRTYSVVTLNEECGLLQWVPNTTPIRPVLFKAYQARGIEPWGAKVLPFFPKLKEANSEEASRIFVHELLPAFPPVFHEWFLDMFPDPSAWLASRMAFSRTAAVISIVGAMLGLGDRHSENILLDILTGDVVHVDFNCLFEKGKLLDIPERVPFRLTQNIVDGLGVTGVEGVFRIACEIVMKLLRDYKDCLMNVLEAFIHDPLVEWVEEKHRKERQAHRNSARGQKVQNTPDIKAIGMHALQLISRKLSGMQTPDDFKNDRVISPSDQVAHLISEASNPRNLGKMYSGWAAWL